jgi:pimeloyl-ACP methyl ester carboxylesterase
LCLTERGIICYNLSTTRNKLVPEMNMKKIAIFLCRGPFLILIAVFFGCYPQANIPIETLQYDAHKVQGPRSLIVFLPGNGDSIAVFQKQGLVAAVRERGLPIDMIAVNGHIGYYMNWTILVRLKEDVIMPAKSGSYDQIWLVGDSMGGYGSISFAKQYPNDITGVVLLGPFLGEKKLIDEIKHSGGLHSWDPGNITSTTREAWERSIWAWLKEYTAEKKPSLKLYLGYGRDDRFAYAQDYLASLVLPEHVIAIDGGHNWRTWKKIWLILLDKNIFQKKEAAQPLSFEKKR